MKEKLTNNLKLKITAVLFAAALWMVSININDPYQSKDYNVEVKLLNENVMTAAGKYVEVIDNSDKITVKVRGNRSVMESFSSSDISAFADLTELDGNNQIQIKVSSAKGSGNKIESLTPSRSFVTVKVENIKKIQKTIEVVTKNTPAKNYILGKTSTEQNALRISGPESLVNTVDRAVVNFDLDEAKDDVSMILPIELYDSEDKKINDNRLQMSIKEVQCLATILETKEVPVKFSARGIVGKGYGFTGEIQCEPSTVLIAGKSSQLRKVQEIEIKEPIDIQNAKADVTYTVDLKEFLPENIIIAASSFDGKVKATAVIEQELAKIIQVAADEVELVNVPEDMKAKFTDSEEIFEIEIVGYASAISDFEPKRVKAQIDFSAYADGEEQTEWKAGTYKMDIILELPEGIWMEETTLAEIEIDME